MFSLVIVLISIALVAAPALATLYYGGSAFSQGDSAAQAARLNNEAQQIEGAVTLFKAEQGREPADLGELTLNRQYLSQIPQDSWVSASQFVLTPESRPVPDDVCLTFNRTRGVPLIPQCNDPAFEGSTVCCSTTP